MPYPRQKLLCLLICGSLFSTYSGLGWTQTASSDTTPSTASESPQKSLQVIEVTGSLLRSVDAAQAQPVTTISAADIQRQGFATVGQLLQNITMAATPDISKSDPYVGGGDAGGSNIDLRGLGTQRTLVLIDGRRMGSSYSGVTNLDSIPVSIVDHIDVLADGASAIYGSDAIGGVINVITKKNFNGAQLDTYDGKYLPYGDGTQKQYSVSFGKSNARGSIFLSAQFESQDGIAASRRPFSAYQLTDRFPLNGLDPTVPYGAFYNADNSLSVLNPGGDPRNINDYHTQIQPVYGPDGRVIDAGDTYNLYKDVSLQSSSTMKNLFLQGQYNVSDNLTASLSASFNQDSSTANMGGSPLSSFGTTSTFAQYNMPVLSAQSYYNPTNTPDQTPTDLFFQRRVVELPRLNINKSENFRFNLGLDGYFSLGERQFNWKAYYYGTRYAGTLTNTGNFYLPNLVNALGPSFMAANGNVECGTPDNVIAGCVPLNALSGPGGYTPAMLHYIQADTYERYGSTEKGPQIDVSGDILTLPAGEVNVAFGASHRSVSGYDTPDWRAQETLTTNTAGQPTRGGYHVTEAYGEMEVPILSDLPFARSLNVDIASRFSHYSSFGNTHNNQYKITWKPIDDLLLRGSYGAGFRAPTVHDLYQGAYGDYPSYNDPCDVVYGLARYNSTVAKNCANGIGGQPGLSATALNAAGLGGLYANGFVQEQAAGLPVTSAGGYPVYGSFYDTGNPKLRPETSKSTQIGFVYSPSYLPGFNASVDHFDYRLSNVIAYQSAEDVLDGCYLDSNTADCALFHRSANTQYQVSALLLAPANINRFQSAGYDVNLTYALPKFSFGNIKLVSQSTYNTRYATQSGPGEPFYSQNGLNSSWRLRSNFTVGWDLHNFGAQWTLRYYSPLKDSCYNVQYSAFPCTLPHYAQPGFGATPMTQIPSVTYSDVQVHWKGSWGGEVSLGVNNVFDRKAPYIYSATGSSTGSDSAFSYNVSYDYGRFVYLRYTQRF